jgi:hypothetical protein
MLKTKKTWFYTGVLLLGIVLGMLSSSDDVSDARLPQGRWKMAILEFCFFFGFILLTSLLEQIAIGISKMFRQMITKHPANDFVLSGWPNTGPFIICAGIFFLCFGFGLAASACWRGSTYFWQGFEFLSASLGLLLGHLSSRRIFRKSNPTQISGR